MLSGVKNLGIWNESFPMDKISNKRVLKSTERISKLYADENPLNGIMQIKQQLDIALNRVIWVIYAAPKVTESATLSAGNLYSAILNVNEQRKRIQRVYDELDYISRQKLSGLTYLKPIYGIECLQDVIQALWEANKGLAEAIADAKERCKFYSRCGPYGKAVACYISAVYSLNDMFDIYFQTVRENVDTYKELKATLLVM